MPPMLRMHAPDLVRGHFFEPAISMNTRSDQPLLAPGFRQWKRQSSPLRIGIHSLFKKPNELFSVTVEKSLDQLPEPAYCGSITSEGFSGVEFCLTNCTQQCLVREPLLATVLSTITITAENFQETMLRSWKQSESKEAKGALGDEMYEHIFFVAIQLASHGKQNFGHPNIMEFVNLVRTYMCADTEQVASYDTDAMNALRMSKPSPRKTRVEKSVSWTYTKTVQSLLQEQNMPWLVPAYSKEKLKDGSAVKVLKDFLIAGLVPGHVDSPFDAYAYVLDSVEIPNWVFKLCAPSDSYSLFDAQEILKKNCTDEPLAQSCHAMLLGINAQQKSEATAWMGENIYAL